MNAFLKIAFCMMCVASFAITPSTVFADEEEEEPQVIGQVKVLDGDAYIVRRDQRVDLAEGVDVFLDDEAFTGTDGALGVTLADSTTLSLGPDSALVLDDFVYDPAGQELGMEVNLLQGTLAYVSGAIASLSPESVRLTTPTATIGIRGTKILIKANAK